MYAPELILKHTNLFTEHLDALLMNFPHHFEDLYFTKFAWIQNPFVDEQDDEFGLPTIEKEKLIELSCDSSLKQKFHSEHLVQFWLDRSEEYNILSSKACKYYRHSWPHIYVKQERQWNQNIEPIRLVVEKELE